MSGRMFARVLRRLERGEAPRLQRAGWRMFYGALGRVWRDPDWRFMNYGWLPPAGADPIELAPDDEPDRPFIGLYDHVARGLPLEGARVLEVGCGRGGGARYVARYFAPAEVVAVDFSASTIERARRLNADTPRLTLQVGDAENLPFPDAAFDVVLNVESAHCYGDMDRFVGEVVRVLRPGGWFGFADMRSHAMVAATDRQLAHADLVLERSRTISDGALRALDAAQARKTGRIRRLPLMRRFMTEFSGSQGSMLYRGLQRGKVVYLSRRLRKRG